MKKKQEEKYKKQQEQTIGKNNRKKQQRKKTIRNKQKPLIEFGLVQLPGEIVYCFDVRSGKIMMMIVYRQRDRE